MNWQTVSTNIIEGSAIMEQNNMDLSRAMENRNKIIIRTSVIGIIANIFLAGFKAVVGVMANSIAVILDAVNNLSDAMSSVITIIGTKLAGKRPDKKHPLGYGRIEYLSAMIVAAIVLYAGITSLVESIKKMIHPEKADYSVISLIVIASAVAVKLILGSFVKKTGEKVNSGSLIASGSDALFDAILSASVLLSAVIYLIWGVGLEPYVGVIISLFIIRSGIEMLTDTLDEILGRRADREQVEQLKKTICEEENVSGAYDLILHSYGPEKTIGSVHVEIPDTLTANEIDMLERRISQRVFAKHGVIMAGIGIYSINTESDEINAMRSEITRVIMEHEGVLQLHGFYADLEHKTVTFDVIIDYALKDRESLYEHISEDVRRLYPDYEFHINLDIDI